MPARLLNRICRSEDDSDERRHFIIICSLDHSPRVDKPKRRIEQPKTYSSHSGGSAFSARQEKKEQAPKSERKAFIQLCSHFIFTWHGSSGGSKKSLERTTNKNTRNRNDKINKEKRRAGTAKEKYVCKFLHHFRALILCIPRSELYDGNDPTSNQVIIMYYLLYARTPSPFPYSSHARESILYQKCWRHQTVHFHLNHFQPQWHAIFHPSSHSITSAFGEIVKVYKIAWANKKKSK